MNTPTHISTAEAASLLGVHVSTISRRVSSGDLVPSLRIGGGKGGGAMFFNLRDIKKLAKAERSKAAA